MSVVGELQNTDNVTDSNKCVENISTNNTEINETKYEFTRKAIENLGNRIRITDTTPNGLELFCYNSCGPNDSSLIRRCRGVVFNGDDIVMHAFPYTIEFSSTEKKKIEENIQSEFEKCTFFDSHEGTLIRMFNFSGRWYTSTHRKLNAFRSRWSSKESFGTSFKRALETELENNDELRKNIPSGDEGLLERFQSTLDPTKQYMFLVLHNEENRIVCDSPYKPTVYHVGTFVNGDLVMNENIHIPYPKRHSFLNIDELTEYVNNININKIQGVIIFTPGNKQYKILNEEYLKFFRARGNEPSIKFRYLQVRMNKNMVDRLYSLYPDMIETFEKYENNLYSIAKNIYHSYVQRHIKGKWSTLPNQEYQVDKACHFWHEENRKSNIVSLEKVIEVLNRQHPSNLNAMIRRFNNENKIRLETMKSGSNQFAYPTRLSINKNESS